MNRNWLIYQRQIAMLLAATPLPSPKWSERQVLQLQATDYDLYYGERSDRQSRPVTLPGIRRG